MPSLYYKKPEILSDSSFLKGHAVIEASAGTGKTYTLEHLVLELLIAPPTKDPVALEEILIVTFTEAATRDLKERIRDLIAKALDKKPPPASGCDQAHYWAIDAECEKRL